MFDSVTFKLLIKDIKEQVVIDASLKTKAPTQVVPSPWKNMQRTRAISSLAALVFTPTYYL